MSDIAQDSMSEAKLLHHLSLVYKSAFYGKALGGEMQEDFKSN